MPHYLWVSGERGDCIIYIIILIVSLCVVRCLMMSLSLKQEKIDSYAKQLPELPYLEYEEIRKLFVYTDDHLYSEHTIMPKEIKSKNDFKASFNNLMNAQIKADRTRQVLYVNKLAIFMIKYYGKFILEYGNNREKAVFKNNINLLKMNGFIK